MTQIGVVKKITDTDVIVSVARKGACGDNCSMCGACQVEPLEVSVRCDIDVLVGDTVEIFSPDGAILFGMISLFILPILLPLLAYITVYNFLGTLAAWVAAGVTLLLCVVLIYILSRHSVFLKRTKPYVCRVLRR